MADVCLVPQVYNANRYVYFHLIMQMLFFYSTQKLLKISFFSTNIFVKFSFVLEKILHFLSKSLPTYFEYFFQDASQI